MTILLRILLVLGGYVFGLFQTGYFLGKLTNKDLRKSGSGNTGATNALRVMGIKGGLIVLFFDALKAFIPCFIVKLVFKDDVYMSVYLFYTALGAVLGNNYPFYLGFKGGKGVAATCGYGLAWNWIVWASCMAFFFLIAVTTGYVSLASCLVSVVIFISAIIYAIVNKFPAPVMIEFLILAFLLMAMTIFRHKSNIQRLLNGTENRFGHKKKKAE